MMIDEYLDTYNVKLPLLLRFVKERGGNIVIAQKLVEEWAFADKKFEDQHQLEKELIKESAMPEALEQLAEKLLSLKDLMENKTRELRQPWKWLSKIVWR